MDEGNDRKSETPIRDLYKDVFHPITAEAREELNKQIMDAYEQKLEEEQGEQLDEGEAQEPVTQTM